MTSREETTVRSEYGERYRSRDRREARRVERVGLGTGCGVNGYTSLAQADWLVEQLALPVGARVLDVGCGCGWPGLHLARRCGSRVVGCDLPLEGLERAARNAREAGLDASCDWVAASARALPYRDAAFGAVVHADVLC